MRLVLPRKYDTYFAFNYIPYYLYKLVLFEDKKGTFDKMDDYLKNNLGINHSCLEILNVSLGCLFTSLDSFSYTLDTYNVNRVKNTHYRLNDLINLIEFGNLEIKGTHIFARLFDTIRYASDYLYKKYRLAGGR